MPKTLDTTTRPGLQSSSFMGLYGRGYAGSVILDASCRMTFQQMIDVAKKFLTWPISLCDDVHKYLPEKHYDVVSLPLILSPYRQSCGANAL